MPDKYLRPFLNFGYFLCYNNSLAKQSWFFFFLLFSNKFESIWAVEDCLIQEWGIKWSTEVNLVNIFWKHWDTVQVSLLKKIWCLWNFHITSLSLALTIFELRGCICMLLGSQITFLGNKKRICPISKSCSHHKFFFIHMSLVHRHGACKVQVLYIF